MRKALLVLLGLAIAVPSISMGGTSRSPEITDPAGDAIITPALAGTAPAAAPWADLTSVYFSTTTIKRAKRKIVTGFTVTFKTMAAPTANQGASLTANWSVGANCIGSVTVWRFPTGTSPDNQVYFGCNSDDPKSIADDNFTAPVSTVTKGNTIVAKIPLSVFNHGLSVGVYKKGTKLTNTYATAAVATSLVGSDFLRVDSAPDETIAGTLIPGFVEFGRDYVIGS